MTAAKLKLTPLEREILDHRLSIPDCIAEALTDVCEGDPEPPYSIDEVEHVAKLLGVSRDLQATYESLTAEYGPVVAAVLKDAVEASTYFGAATGENNDGKMSDQKLRSIGHAGCRLATKIGDMIGEVLIYPLY